MTDFATLGLRADLLEAVGSLGFETPTPIQEQAIPVLLQGGDVVGQAKTGTGKTAAFGLPLLQRLEASPGPVQGMVLVPTRELAMQVTGQLAKLGAEGGAGVVALYGGQSIHEQLRALKARPRIVVGTPGRVQDHLRRGTLDLSQVSVAVLDEADEMLAIGFFEEVEAILSTLPQERQTCLFSATFPDKVKRLIKKFLPKARRIEVCSSDRTVASVTQTSYESPPGQKATALVSVLELEDPEMALVFCRTRQETQELTTILRSQGLAAECLNGEMGQSERDRVMERFRAGHCRLLIATDVAARGLDLENLSHVLNYGLPRDSEQYIHRIGRTGRAGRSGTAITVHEPSERRRLLMIAKFAGTRINALRLPTPADLVRGREQRFASLIRRLFEVTAAPENPAPVERLLKGHESGELARVALQALWEARGFDRPILAVDVNSRADFARAERDYERDYRRGERDRPRPERAGPEREATRPERARPARDTTRPERPRPEHEASRSERPRPDYDRPAQARPLADPAEGRRPRGSLAGMAWIKLAAGTRDGLRPKILLAQLANELGLTRGQMGSIRIEERKSWIEVDARTLEAALRRLPGVRVLGKKIQVVPPPTDQPRRKRA